MAGRARVTPEMGNSRTISTTLSVSNQGSPLALITEAACAK
jgi:hypothetical protein